MLTRPALGGTRLAPLVRSPQLPVLDGRPAGARAAQAAALCPRTSSVLAEMRRRGAVGSDGPLAPSLAPPHLEPESVFLRRRVARQASLRSNDFSDAHTQIKKAIRVVVGRYVLCSSLNEALSLQSMHAPFKANSSIRQDSNGGCSGGLCVVRMFFWCAMGRASVSKAKRAAGRPSRQLPDECCRHNQLNQ